MILEQNAPLKLTFICIFAAGPAARKHRNIFVLSACKAERCIILGQPSQGIKCEGHSWSTISDSLWMLCPGSRNASHISQAALPLASGQKALVREKGEASDVCRSQLILTDKKTVKDSFIFRVDC